MPSPEITDVELRMRAKRSAVDRRVGEAQAIATRGRALVGEIATLTEQADVLGKASTILTTIGEERQQRAQETIEQLVTHGLRTIFDSALSFHIVQDVKRNQVDASFIVRSTLVDGSVIDTPVMDARGGGVAATIGFLIRLVVMLLGKDRQRMLLVLDETFAHLSAEFEPRLAEFIAEVVERTPVQIIMVTHSDAYTDSAQAVYRFSLDEQERTQVEKLK